MEIGLPHYAIMMIVASCCIGALMKCSYSHEQDVFCRENPANITCQKPKPVKAEESK